MFTFPTSFFWNGVDNILVEICDGETGNGTGDWFEENPTIAFTTGLPFNGSHTRTADNGDNLCGTTTVTNNGTQTTRPNIIFSWTPANGCAGKPNAGTAASTLTNVCLAQNFTLSLSGQSIAAGISYKWQSSTNNTTWIDIPGGNSMFFTTSQGVTHCTGPFLPVPSGGLTDTSTVVQVVSPPLAQGIYSINSTQATAGRNFRSFKDAVDFLKCGIGGSVVFNVAANTGPYAEQVTIPAISGSSAVNTITFNGNGTHCFTYYLHFS